MIRCKLRFCFSIVILFAACCSLYAQTDTVKRLTIDSLFLRQKGLLRKIGQNLLKDSTNYDRRVLLRNDVPFQKYSGRIIRDIYILTLEFGISMKDTTRSFKNKLIRVSNKLHYQTRDNVIRNNLFFYENQKLSPYVLGDNERHLRDLPFIKDARITIEPDINFPDSVDVVIYTKDVLSVGGTFNSGSNSSVDFSLKEDNFLGFGDRLQAQTLFDNARDHKTGYGFSYIKRNMGGTFVDATAGFTNFNRAFSSNRRDETFAYLSFVKPFVSRYLKWTYGINAELHNTERLYKTDTVYRLEHRYRYHLFDTWAVWNMDASKSNRFLTGDDRYQKLIGIRVLETQFTAKPDRFLTEQYFRYNNVRAVLADISVYKQDFYKIKYIYGFGRNEDVPEGVNTSVTVGYTQINERGRPYAAFNYQRNYFTDTKQYFNYTLRTGFYKYRSKLEDVNILGSIDYITRLVQLSNSWKQRIFLSASVASQIRSVYNEPLVLESDYGLQDFNNNGQGAKSRVSMRGEAVFYSPISVAFFKFAPFAFANTSFLNLKSAVKANDQKIYSALGGGLRIRNESLIFGTMELKGIYFPRKNFFGDQWRFEFGTNIRFKYNRELIRRPEFVVIN